MNTKLLKCALFGMSVFVSASTGFARGYEDDVIRIEVGKQRGDYSREELERRVWQLERAVWQLQQRVFDLETVKPEKPPQIENWICSVNAFGATHTGTGKSKAEAMANSINNCKKEANDNGFFCKNPKCEK